ncbi:MAG: MFS transporter [Candidatus Nanopelagicales bacterium]
MSADAESGGGGGPSGVVRGHPRVLTLAAAYTFSSFGSAVSMLAFSYVSYVITGSLIATVAVMAASALPALVLMQPAARLTRRFDLRALCAVLAVAKMALFLIVGVIFGMGYISFWLLLITSLVNGIVGAFTFPPWNNFLRKIAPAGRIADLNAVLMSASAIAGIVGVIAGGLMLDAWGLASLFYVNAISYAVYAVPFALFPPVRAAKSGAARTSMREAARVIRDDNLLSGFVIVALVVQLVAWPLLNLLPKISSTIGTNAVIYSLLLSSIYAGMALVAPLLALREKRRSPWQIAMGALLILTIATLIVGVSPLIDDGSSRLILLMVVLIPLGMALNMTTVLVSAAVQSGAPDEYEASVLAVYSAGITVITPVGALIVAAIADATNVWAAVVVQALGIGALLAFLATPRMRRHFEHALGDKDHVILRHARHGAVSRNLPGDMEPVLGSDRDPVTSGGTQGA